MKKLLFLLIFVLVILISFKFIFIPKEKRIISENKDIIYFAYGSNMNTNQMNNRCLNGFEKISNGKLLNYEFGFDKSGYANIREFNDKIVFGVIYKLTKSCLNNLDQYEGYPDHYNRRIVKIQNIYDNQFIDSYVYIESKDQFNGNANQSYLDIILNGAIENELPIN